MSAILIANEILTDCIYVTTKLTDFRVSLLFYSLLLNYQFPQCTRRELRR